MSTNVPDEVFEEFFARTLKEKEKKTKDNSKVLAFGEPIFPSWHHRPDVGLKRSTRQYLSSLWPNPENSGNSRDLVAETLFRSCFPAHADKNDEGYAGKVLETMRLTKLAVGGGIPNEDYIRHVAGLWGGRIAEHVRDRCRHLDRTLAKAEILGFPKFRKEILSPRIGISTDSQGFRLSIRKGKDVIFANAEELRNHLVAKRRAKPVEPVRESSNPSIGSISIEDFLEKFGTRGVEFGLRIPKKERDAFLVRTADAFSDLAAILGIREKEIGDGRLSLSLGSRPYHSTSAHYSPTAYSINLSRHCFLGAIAHEWGHFLDHWRLFPLRNNMAWLTESETEDFRRWHRFCIRGSLGESEFVKRFIPEGKQHECFSAFRECVSVDDYVGKFSKLVEKFVPKESASLWLEFMETKRRERPKTAFLADAERMERKCRREGGHYWADSGELWARAFELFIFRELEKREWRNDFLVNPWEREERFPPHQEMSRWERIRDDIYPKKEIDIFAKRIGELLDRVFPGRNSA